VRRRRSATSGSDTERARELPMVLADRRIRLTRLRKRWGVPTGPLRAHGDSRCLGHYAKAVHAISFCLATQQSEDKLCTTNCGTLQAEFAGLTQP
jgi:hypothetical protein